MSAFTVTAHQPHTNILPHPQDTTAPCSLTPDPTILRRRNLHTGRRAHPTNCTAVAVQHHPLRPTEETLPCPTHT